MALNGICDLYAGHLVDSEGGLSATGIRHFANPQNITSKPKVNSEKAYGGNRVIDQAAQFDSCDVTLGLYDLTAIEQAFLLSQFQPEEGGVVLSAEDEGGYICLMFKAPLHRKHANGVPVNRYGYIYKVQFQPYDETMKTLEGKPDFSQTPSLSGTAQPTDFKVTDANGVDRHLVEWWVDDDDANCPADIATTWYQFLHVPSADTTAPTVTTVPADAATAVVDSSMIVWTFSKAINALTVTKSNFKVIKASDGTEVAGALSLDNTGKIVTFTPSAAFSTATAYIAFATENITSAAGIPLAAANIINFTTA